MEANNLRLIIPSMLDQHLEDNQPLKYHRPILQ